jgi:phosphonate transport system substrate-binding protein
MHRRTFLGMALACAGSIAAHEALAQSPLRIGLTPVFLDDQAAFLDQWRSYLEGQLLRPIAFVQRGTYREIVDLLRQGNCDIAWVCGYPYVRNRQQMRLVAVPEFDGRPVYRSYLIVPAKDTATKSMLDLRGRVFAFSDPDSNSGYLFPTYRLHSLHERADSFFGKSFFTWAHRKVVEAVAGGVADGGAVDGYIWETLARIQPKLVAATRIVERSPEFGFPPIVARASLAASVVAEVRRVLITMADDPRGRDLLKALNLTGFVAGDDRLYAGIERMAHVIGDQRRAAAA